jgi:molecular chaperone HscC
VIVGIDLGTTNSAVAVWRHGTAELIPNSLGHTLTPSAVSIDDEGKLLVGLAARERQTTHPAQTATIFKRYMGTQKSISLGKKNFLPEDLSAMVLQSLKRDAEAFLGASVTEAIITVPAYFNDKQRQATRRAGEIAGLRVERLLNEPTAAALAYGIHELQSETKFLVFDLGGGTFDVSILEIFDGVIEVRATTGDNRLGGEDFNDALVAYMRDTVPADPNEALNQRLRAAAETARRALSEHADAQIELVWNGRSYAKAISATTFEQLVAPLIDRLRVPVLRSLRDSGLNPASLQEIVLVGGATRMPVVRRSVAKMFGRFPAFSVNPDEAVALGAAIQAGLKARDAALTEMTVTDVCPYSLGIDTAERDGNGQLRDGIFSPILERNTVVPASRVKTFSTLHDGQREVKMNVYQGEARLVAENIHLGQITIPVPAKLAGQVRIECRFSYDINGLIEVDVDVPETRTHRQLVIVDPGMQKSKDLEARRRALEALKIHPRDTDANRAALARAARCYEDNLGAKRDMVSGYIRQFETALDRQDPREVEAARAELLAALDRLEGETYF